MAGFLNRGIIGMIVFRVLIVLVSLGTCSAKFSANFVFGDSLVEVGNNNYIKSLSKADCEPNGIDFGKPTGRFTNDRTIVDILGQELGFNGYTPPYLAPTTVGPVILQGVNYASGGGGILNETGKIFGGRINLDAQLDNFANTKQDIISSIGFTAAMKLFSTALFSVTMGSNDFINNYLTPILSIPEQKKVSPEEFVGAMVSRFKIQLTIKVLASSLKMRLYDMGARKIVVPNVGPIGCIPYQRDINLAEGEDCAPFPNQLAQMYNSQMKELLIELGPSLEGSIFVYADVYKVVAEIIENPVLYGFESASYACCHLVGKHGGIIPCGPPSKICPDRSKYVFWDPYHPSDATNVILAQRLLDGDSSYISPINIRTLSKSSE